jgi:hypothetical protein
MLCVDYKNADPLPHLGASTEEAETLPRNADTIRDFLEMGTSRSVNFPATTLPEVPGRHVKLRRCQQEHQDVWPPSQNFY